MAKYNFNIPIRNKIDFVVNEVTKHSFNFYIKSIRQFDLIIEGLIAYLGLLVNVEIPFALVVDKIKSKIKLFGNMTFQTITITITTKIRERFHISIVVPSIVINPIISFISRIININIDIPFTFDLINKEHLRIPATNITVPKITLGITTICKKYHLVSDWDNYLLSDLDSMLLSELDYEVV
jgi:hypothetical protein